MVDESRPRLRYGGMRKIEFVESVRGTALSVCVKAISTYP
jgi:hypothetical protein